MPSEPRSARRTATLADVAAASGVSLATVSRYRRGLRRPAEAVRERIDAAVRQLGYRDNLLARSLATGRSGTVGLVLLDLGNPHFTQLARAAHEVALEHDRALALIDASEGEADTLHGLQALARRVDGLVVSARLSDEALAWLAQLGKPVVLFGRAQPGFHGVRSDGAEGARQLGAHLLAAGHRRITYLSWPRSRWSAEREAALRRVCRQQGAAFDVQPVAAASAAAGEAVAAGVMFGAKPPDAVVAYNDLIAMGFLRAAQQLGFSVPRQLSVAGFDDIPVAACLQPALTTVSLHSRSQGRLAMQRLLELIDAQPATGAAAAGAPGEDIVPPSLILRASTRRASLEPA